MSTTYEADVVAWANQQAALLRAGKFSQLDIEHLADEVEDVGKSEKRELASRMAVLLAHLLKWQVQPERRSKSWLITIAGQRDAVASHLEDVPSLKALLRDLRWWRIAWADAARITTNETEVGELPEMYPWTQDQILDPEFLPA